MTNVKRVGRPLPTVGVFTVATNIYLDYWQQMALSADEFLFPDRKVTLYVLTDRPDEALWTGENLSRVTIRAIRIPPLEWPAATLDRYALLVEHQSRIKGDLLMHVDADMLCVAPVGRELDEDRWPGGLAFVRHPGYFRPSGLARLRFYLSSPSTGVRDAWQLIQTGGIGFWETRPTSNAFVHRNRRDHYYCGGVWFGKRSSVLQMAKLLADRTAADTACGLHAVWHDESHLNWYATHYPHADLGPNYCHVSSYPQLRGITPSILPVDKGAARTR